MPPSDLHVTAWVDPLVDERGHPANSPYVEMFWLPVLGPSATFLLRRVNLYLGTHPEGLSIDAVELSRELGLGHSQSKHAPLSRAIDRCIRFGLARRKAPEHLAVRRVIGPLPLHRVTRLPPMLQRAHSAWPEERLSPRSLGKACDPALPASAPSPTADLRGG